MICKDFREILSGQLIALTGGVFAGFLLTFATDKLYLVPSLFILFPGFMEMRGNISGTMSARLTSGLFVGVMKYGHERKKIIHGNMLASIILVIAISLFLGIMAYYVSYVFFGINNLNIILVALLAGIISNAIQMPLTLFTTLWIFKRGHDPSNIMGPYITMTGDVISILSLVAAILVIA